MRLKPTSLAALLFVTPAVAAFAGDRAYRELLDAAIGDARRELSKKLSLYEDHSTWETAWRIPTEHYVIRTVLGYPRGVKLGEGMERMYGYFRDLFVAEPRTFPLNAFVLPDLAAYNQFGNDNGEHHSSSYGVFYPAAHAEKPVATYFDGDEVRLRQFLTHGAVHQYLDAAFGPVARPTWLEEGLAGYFETFWDFDNSVAAFDHLRANNRYIPVGRLLDAGIDAYGGDHYAESGIFVHYLLNVREDTRTRVDSTTGEVTAAPFRDYVRAVLSGGDVNAIPVVQKLLTSGRAQLDADFKSAQFR